MFQDSEFQDFNILKCSRTQESNAEISESRHRSAGLPTAPTARLCPCPATRSHAAHDAAPVAASRGWRSQRPHAAGGRRPRPATLLCRPWPTPTPAAADRGSPRHPLLHLAAAALGGRRSPRSQPQAAESPQTQRAAAMCHNSGRGPTDCDFHRFHGF